MGDLFEIRGPHSRAKNENVPPRLEPTNQDRAEWAEVALRAFQEATGADECDALGDLLADLMHWCDGSGYAFNHALKCARMHYDAETSADPTAR
jgi:hypothetical protein